MTAKRFRLEDCVVNGVGEIVGVYFKDNHDDELLKYEDIVRIANELHEENQRLKSTSQKQAELLGVQVEKMIKETDDFLKEVFKVEK